MTLFLAISYRVRYAIGIRAVFNCVQSCCVQPSQGMEVESEYEDEPMEEDELVSEEEQEVQTFSVCIESSTPCLISGSRLKGTSCQERRREATEEAEKKGR